MEVRNAQVNALGRAQEEDFRRRLKEKLLEDYPEDSEALGEDKLDVVIDQGIERARSYGIAAEDDIGLYFDIMFNLAYNFDTNPKYPWAGPILRNPTLTAEEKLRQVSGLAQEALDREADEE